jgi:hypothetical protein
MAFSSQYGTLLDSGGGVVGHIHEFIKHYGICEWGFIRMSAMVSPLMHSRNYQPSLNLLYSESPLLDRRMAALVRRGTSC